MTRKKYEKKFAGTVMLFPSNFNNYVVVCYELSRKRKERFDVRKQSTINAYCRK